MFKKLTCICLLMFGLQTYAQTEDGDIEDASYIQSRIQERTIVSIGVSSPRPILTALQKEIYQRGPLKIGIDAQRDASGLARIQELKFDEIGKDAILPYVSEMCALLDGGAKIEDVAQTYELAADAEEDAMQETFDFIQASLSTEGTTAFNAFADEIRQQTVKTRIDWVGLSADVPNYAKLVFTSACARHSGTPVRHPTFDLPSDNTPIQQGNSIIQTN